MTRKATYSGLYFMKYYHVTSRVFNLKPGDYLLPAIESRNLREQRSNNLDVVFLTYSLASVRKYVKIIPDPVVFEVEFNSSNFIVKRYTEVLVSKAKIKAEILL